MTDHKTPLARALFASGISANALAKMVGTSRQNVGRWSAGIVKLPIEQAQKIAPALGVSVADLMLGDLAPPMPTSQKQGAMPVAHVHVRGNVQAGIWAEFDEFPDVPVEHVPVVPGRWSHLEQFAYRVHGPSVNKLRIFDGDYVICVPYWQAKDAFGSGDIVVAERRRPRGRARDRCPAAAWA